VQLALSILKEEEEEEIYSICEIPLDQCDYVALKKTTKQNNAKGAKKVKKCAKQWNKLKIIKTVTDN
jgi:hypothetical protein